MKCYYAGQECKVEHKSRIFLGGTTILGNSWRRSLVKELEKQVGDLDIGIWIPEPKDEKILTWAEFYDTQPAGYNQIAWEIEYGKPCLIWTMYMPVYVNKFQAGKEFQVPASSPERSYPIATKALLDAKKQGTITSKEYEEEMQRLTNANLGCQVRFEAGMLAERCVWNKEVQVVWGKVYNSQQISFDPYLKKEVNKDKEKELSAKMHVLTKEELGKGRTIPESFVADLVEKIKKSSC
jgi:hypothetical protein